MMHVHLLTCDEHPDLTTDDTILRDRLTARGHVVTAGLWTDTEHPAGRFTAVIRSCWDYYQHPEYFLDCIRRLDLKAQVWNSPRVVEWNLDKLYLQDVQEAGVPIIPTVFPGGGGVPVWDCEEIVVKPRVSNAGNGVVRLPRAALLDVLAVAPHFPKQVMVQPFVKEIGEVGEYSLVYIGGKYSHCVHKLPGEGEFRVQHLHGGKYELVEPSPALREAADLAFDVIFEEVLYARIDVIPYQGQYCVSEVELIEPWLHFTECPEAADRLIDALEVRPKSYSK